MGTALVQTPDEARLRSQTFGFFEDFLEFVTGDVLTDTSGDTGATVAASDAAGGVLVITTGATNNNEAYVHNTNESFLFANGKPLYAEARLKFTEANTDDANVAFGVMDAVGADSILDDGAGPKASYSGACFFKVDGGTNWWVEASIAGTQTTVELSAANSLTKTAQTSGGGSYQVLRIDFIPKSSTKADIEFKIDGVLVYKMTDFTYTSATEMEAFVGAKAGGANSEVVSVDYLTAYQKR